MSFTVTCPNCTKRLTVKDEARGGRAKCPGCKQPVELVDDDPIADEFGEVAEDDCEPERKPRGKKNSKSKKTSTGLDYTRIGVVAGGLVALGVVGGVGFSLVKSWTPTVVSAVQDRFPTLFPRPSVHDDPNIPWQSATYFNEVELETPVNLTLNRRHLDRELRSESWKGSDGDIAYIVHVGKFRRTAKTIEDALHRAQELAKKADVTISAPKHLRRGQYDEGDFEGIEAKYGDFGLVQFWVREDGYYAIIGAVAEERGDKSRLARATRLFKSVRFILPPISPK